MANAWHESKVRQARNAILEVNSDTSVEQEDTLDSLITLRDEIDDMIVALKESMPDEEE